MILRERVIEFGRACYRTLRPLRRFTIVGPLIDAVHVRGVLARISGDPRSVRVFAPDEFSPYLRALTPLSPYRDLPGDLTFDAIVVRQDQLNMLAPPLIRALRDAYACVFANRRFALFVPAPLAGQPSAAAVQVAHRLATLAAPVTATAAARTATPADRAILVTTFNRPAALARSLPQIAALGCAVVVVDDGSEGPLARENAALCERHQATRIALPANRGLAAAMNVGLSFLLADPTLQWISYLQDDVDVAPDLMTQLQAIEDRDLRPLITGYDSDRHPVERYDDVTGRRVAFKRSTPAVHLHGHADYWRRVLPIPSQYVGAPRRRWEASLEDYWLVNHAPEALTKKGLMVACLPGLVRTFLFAPGDSTWDNPNQPEPPLAGRGA